ncbi:MAG: hypothetical protein ACYDFU_08565 [Nitrospirota bacterium]
MAVLHKSPEWSYEKEWRLVFPFGESYPNQNYQLLPPSAIYLGTKIKERYRDTLASIGKEKGIPVYQMKLSLNEFKLMNEKIN